MSIPTYAQGKPNYYGVYLLEETGDKSITQAAKKNYIADGTTDGRMEIWDSETGMVSTVTIRIDKNGYYIKKKPYWMRDYRPSKLYLDKFVGDAESEAENE